MFSGATSFNQDISGWNTSNVISMSGVFQGATFNGDISSWDISKVVSIEDMFSGNTSFNQDISGWDVSNVTDMRRVCFMVRILLIKIYLHGIHLKLQI